MKKYLLGFILVGSCNFLQNTPLTLEKIETEGTRRIQKQKGLENCTYHYVEASSDNGVWIPDLRIVKCPNSITSTLYPHNKTTMGISIVDGPQPD